MGLLSGVNELAFASDAVVLKFTWKEEAWQYVESNFDMLREWAKNLRKPAVFVRYKRPEDGRNYFRVLSSMRSAPLMSQSTSGQVPTIQMARDLTSMSLPLFEACKPFFENPKHKGGIVRLRDQLQIVIPNANEELMFGIPINLSVNLRREDFWHPEDLGEFMKQTRQRLEPNNPQSFYEFPFRSFDPETKGDWIEFTNRYRLIYDGTDYFHVSEYMNHQEIPEPASIA